MSVRVGHAVDEEGGFVLYQEIVGRVIHTMCNSFFQAQDLLSRIKNNKGVDAQVSLRDKLKVYASEIHAKSLLP